MECNLHSCLGKETTDATVMAWQLEEKFLVKLKALFINTFVDLEKAFDRVSRKEARWTLRKLVGV